MDSPTHFSTGKEGEEIACAYLVDNGYQILERNARQKWGELDIVCWLSSVKGAQNRKKSVLRRTSRDTMGWVRRELSRERGKLVFIEVKTLRSDALRPEDNMTSAKQKKFLRTCQLYLSEHNIPLNVNWQADVIAVTLRSESELPVIEHLEAAVY
jgi:putative endonuclease